MDAGIDVAGFLEREQVRGVLRIPELVAGGLVDRHGARAGGGIRHLPGMQLPGVQSQTCGWYVVMGCISFFVFSTIPKRSNFLTFFIKQKAPSGYEGAR